MQNKAGANQATTHLLRIYRQILALRGCGTGSGRGTGWTEWTGWDECEGGRGERL